MDARTILREARARAGLTQAQLAGRAGTSQAAVSAYEAGRRTPSAATLERLVAATGGVLNASPTPKLRDRLRNQQLSVLAVLDRYGASDARVFGSVARGEENAGSDIDLLVTLPDDAGLFEVAGLGQALEDILGVAVDVNARAMLPPAARRAAERDAVPL